METTMIAYTTIAGFPDYEISHCGNVRRLLKNGSYREIKGWQNDRYTMITLSKNREKTVIYLHRLVLINFGPKQPEHLPLALHLDDDPTNNTIDNLVWGDKRMNSQMAITNGKLMDHRLKIFLTKDESDQVIRDYASGRSMRSIAKSLGCSRWTVSRIVHGRTAKFL